MKAKHFQITLGTFANVKKLKRVLTDSCRIDTLAHTLLDKVVISKQPTKAKLSICTVSSLGLHGGGTLADIFEAAEKAGFNLCFFSKSRGHNSISA